MNILIITNQLLSYDGVSRHLWHLLSGFTEQYPEYNFTLLSSEAEIPERFRGLPVRIIVEPSLSYAKRSAQNFLLAVKRIRSVIRENNISLIHAHNHYHANAAFHAKVFTGVPVLQTNHGILAPGGILPHFRADHYIGVNPHIIEYMVSQEHISPSQISLVRLCTTEPAGTKRGLHPKMRFLSAGRLIKEKGFFTLIDAVASLPVELRDKCEFTIAGDGADAGALKQRNIELRTGIQFAGQVENLENQLYDYDMLIHPTESASEGFPMIIIESACSGLGIICSRFYGLEYDFNSKEDGYTFAQGDSGELAAAIGYCVTHPAEMAEKASAYRHKSLSLYNKQKMINDLREIYLALMKKV